MATPKHSYNGKHDEPVTFKPEVQSAIEMLDRLYDVDIDQFSVKDVTDELKGQKAWFFVLTMPVAAVALVTFTLVGMAITGYIIASFVVAAGMLFIVGKIIDQYEQKFRDEARLEVMKRIQKTETKDGLLPHFQDFLPKKYRHLWQSLRRQNYIYIDQYIAAIHLLQHHLEPEKFIRVWQLKHPETVEENTEESNSQTTG